MNKTTSKVTKPSQCVLGFGIPTNRQAFLKSVRNKNKDYTKKTGNSWSYYSSNIIQKFNYSIHDIEKAGVTVVHDLTLDKFESLFDKFDVIILFSHWKEDEIEFHEGLIPIEKIVSCIPHEFDGIIDFSVCHPKAISQLIREKELKCTTRYSKGKLDKPEYWLYFYSKLFEELVTNNWYYFDAFREVIFKQLNDK